MPESWINHPRYQRALKRYQRISPEEKATLNLDALMSAIATEDARKQLQYMTLGERKEARLQEKGLYDKGYGLRQDYTDWLGKRSDRAEAYGWANVGLGGLAGWMDLKEKQALNRELGNLANLYRAGMM